MNLRQFLSAALLSFVLGSLHAYSVLLEPLETMLSASRATVSLAYSLAILFLTAGVALSPFIFRFLDPRWTALLLGSGAAAGLVLAAFSRSPIGLLSGFGILFGFCNGVGYALFLSEAAMAFSKHEGLAIGAITAIYSVGTMAFSFVFDLITADASPQWALLFLAICVGAASSFSALGLSGQGSKTSVKSNQLASEPEEQWLMIQIWLIYFCGAAGSLMIVGHAAGIAREAGVTAIVWAPMTVAFGNITGSICGGKAADLCSARQGPTLVSGLGTCAILTLLISPGSAATLFWLGMVGFAYGALIALIPALLSRRFGTVSGAQMFARVFTAWGAAGLATPWAAGVLFDKSGNYQMALAVAVGTAALGVLLTLLLPLGAKALQTG